jgi:hypothetical protein
MGALGREADASSGRALQVRQHMFGRGHVASAAGGLEMGAEQLVGNPKIRAFRHVKPGEAAEE